jgi:hypothetical protein
MADIVSWKDRAERMKASIARHREEARESAESLMGSFEVVAGGALAAVLDAKMPTIPGTEIETKTAVGIGLTLLGLSEPFLKLGEVSRHLCNIGNGVNAVNVYEETKRMLAD